MRADIVKPGEIPNVLSTYPDPNLFKLKAGVKLEFRVMKVRVLLELLGSKN